MSPRPYRFVIVGAGSAGCVLAHRLSEDPTNRVLLLEAGGRATNPFIHMPAGIAKLVNNRDINWGYSTVPQPELCNRRLYWPRGKVLGGSSSINAMCYVRGQPEDYDDWARAGNTGWHFDAVLPYFKRSERHHAGASELHGGYGRLSVERLRNCNPLSEVFVAAGASCGWPTNPDFNGRAQLGVGLYEVTQHAGRRCSSADAYLEPAWARPNLTIATHGTVERIVIEHGRAVGVEYRHGTERRRANVDGEIIVSAGSINSPQLLMLSGVGQAQHLRELGLPVAIDLPAVGENLHDHLDVCTLVRCRQPITYDFDKWAELRVALQYLWSRRGPGASNIAEAGGFVRSRYASDGRPDVQLHFVPAQLDDHGRNRLPGHGFTLHACYLRPRSRGRVRLQTSDPMTMPAIDPQYLRESHDLDVMIDAVRISREILASKPFDPFRAEEIFPGEAARSRQDIVDFIRRKAETIYHPVGTCRMGIGAASVVDPELRVHGIDGLRVVDASIIPSIVSGNTNAPTIMIAERAADLLLGRVSLARRSEAPVRATAATP